jgi:hypothetical protein
MVAIASAHQIFEKVVFNQWRFLAPLIVLS